MRDRSTLIACTLTGVDSYSDLHELSDLAHEFPFVEFGVLLSRTMPGQENRYPHLQQLETIIDRLTGSGAAVALHICGKAVSEFVTTPGEIRELASRVGRVQLNFAADRVHFGMQELDDVITQHGRPVITQHNRANHSVAGALTAVNHQVLFDTSGGLGIRADKWPKPLKGKICGYAGGIGPATAAQDVETAFECTDGAPCWIDMESLVRSDDKFDASLARSVLAAVDGVLDAGTHPNLQR